MSEQQEQRERQKTFDAVQESMRDVEIMIDNLVSERDDAIDERDALQREVEQLK